MENAHEDVSEVAEAADGGVVGGCMGLARGSLAVLVFDRRGLEEDRHTEEGGPRAGLPVSACG